MFLQAVGGDGINEAPALLDGIEGAEILYEGEEEGEEEGGEETPIRIRFHDYIHNTTHNTYCTVFS